MSQPDSFFESSARTSGLSLALERSLSPSAPPLAGHQACWGDFVHLRLQKTDKSHQWVGSASARLKWFHFFLLFIIFIWWTRSVTDKSLIQTLLSLMILALSCTLASVLVGRSFLLPFKETFWVTVVMLVCWDIMSCSLLKSALVALTSSPVWFMLWHGQCMEGCGKVLVLQDSFPLDSCWCLKSNHLFLWSPK